ncbi:MAG: ATP synthase F0 subunit B [Acidobacteriota bacterium]
MLDLDITVIYTIIILWSLLVILNKIFYKPVGSIINERETKSETEISEIENMKRNIEERSARIESVMKGARKDSIIVSEDIIKKGEAIREKLLVSTRKKSSEDFKKRMDELDREIVEAEDKLMGEIKNFSKKIEEIFT